MGETESIMKYSRASYIRDLVYNLDQSWEYSHYAAAIKEEDHENNEWSVYLYSRTASKNEFMELVVFARSLDNLACDIFMTITEYNKATYGEEMVHAIKIS